MIPRGSVGLYTFVVIALFGCSTGLAHSGADAAIDLQSQAGTSGSAAQSGAGSGALIGCGWSSALDGSAGQCKAARAYLTCQGSNGGGEGCLSNDLTQCPGPDPVIGETFSACKDACAADEYAVACGGPGPGPYPSPPAGCRDSSIANPGGGSVACCPCALPASAFDCGGEISCDRTTQVCEHVSGGPPPGVDLYNCIAIPTTCASAVSCACVVAAFSGRGADRCDAAGGGITVQIDVP
ncbi:MAG TPA: hypothetical protein VHZ95_05240 [Polyangiales bacterium]|nr:hypothetical protein [Polyangiales bacterium]